MFGVLSSTFQSIVRPPCGVCTSRQTVTLRLVRSSFFPVMGSTKNFVFGLVTVAIALLLFSYSSFFTCTASLTLSQRTSQATSHSGTKRPSAIQKRCLTSVSLSNLMLEFMIAPEGRLVVGYSQWASSSLGPRSKVED